MHCDFLLSDAEGCFRTYRGAFAAAGAQIGIQQRFRSTADLRYKSQCSGVAGISTAFAENAPGSETMIKEHHVRHCRLAAKQKRAARQAGH